jgi:molybdate transport system permease protein
METAVTVDLSPILLSVKLATISTLTLALAGVPFAHWLSGSRSALRLALRALVMLPLVLPPSVLGFYFLLAFNPAAFPGAFIGRVLGLHGAFTFEGIVIASVIAGVPFMVNPVLAGFESLPQSLWEASEVLGKSRAETLLKVLLPSIKPSLMTGMVMTFIHTFGEFGLVLMLGGKIPGKTLTASIALYDCVESLNYRQAHVYAAILVFCSLASLVALFKFSPAAFGRSP